ncbi:hypothetical protein Hanom_Chr14g01281361 [Helianthus anomalus]
MSPVHTPHPSFFLQRDEERERERRKTRERERDAWDRKWWTVDGAAMCREWWWLETRRQRNGQLTGATPIVGSREERREESRDGCLVVCREERIRKEKKGVSGDHRVTTGACRLASSFQVVLIPSV